MRHGTKTETAFEKAVFELDRLIAEYETRNHVFGDRPDYEETDKAKFGFSNSSLSEFYSPSYIARYGDYAYRNREFLRECAICKNEFHRDELDRVECYHPVYSRDPYLRYYKLVCSECKQAFQTQERN